MNITLNDNEISIIREGIIIEKNIIDMGIKEYKKELEEYEERYKMTSEEFIRRYNNGELGDEEKWFDWLLAYKAFNHLIERERLIKGINI